MEQALLGTARRTASGRLDRDDVLDGSCAPTIDGLVELRLDRRCVKAGSLACAAWTATHTPELGKDPTHRWDLVSRGAHRRFAERGGLPSTFCTATLNGFS